MNPDDSRSCSQLEPQQAALFCGKCGGRALWWESSLVPLLTRRGEHKKLKLLITGALECVIYLKDMVHVRDT